MSATLPSMFLFAPAVVFSTQAAVNDGATADAGAGAPTAPLDPTTGQPIPPRDATGQPTTPRDATGQPIVPRDATGQPLIPKDETGQIAPPGMESETAARADSFLRDDRMALDPNELGRLRDGALGQDWRAQVALVAGYNSNVVQSQAVVGGPATAHPALFAGIDASAEWSDWWNIHDQQSIRLQVRGQQYVPLDGYSEPDDGSVNAGWNGQYTLGANTYLQGRALLTVSTVNSAQLDDGPLFQINPSDVQRTYTLETARLAVVHELSPRWRWVSGVGVEVSTTIRDVPIQLDDGQNVYHRGLDYVTPEVDTSLFHDLDDRNIGALTLTYDPTYIAFLVDYTRDPPLYNGTTTLEAAEMDATWIHAFSERLRSTSTLGLIVTSAPPFDADQRPIESPVLGEELTYLGNYWSAVAAVGYTYGSANPRLGFGPSASASLAAQGVPFPHGDWRNFSMIALGVANRSVFEEAPNALSRLTFAEASLELRYGVNNWLGVIAGYDARYASFEGADAYPTLVRHIVFVGLSGYFATDRSLPTLETFVSPIKPPG